MYKAKKVGKGWKGGKGGREEGVGVGGWRLTALKYFLSKKRDLLTVSGGDGQNNHEG